MLGRKCETEFQQLCSESLAVYQLIFVLFLSHPNIMGMHFSCPFICLFNQTAVKQSLPERNDPIKSLSESVIQPVVLVDRCWNK